MSDSLTGLVNLLISANMIKDLDLADAKFPLSQTWAQEFQSGSGSGQINKLFADTRTLADGANEELDLAGALTDPFGASLTFTKVKVLAIKNKSATQTLSVGGAAANAWSALFGDATDILKIAPSSMALLVCDPAGVAVTAATADLLKIANSAGAAADYDIIVLGI